jgi:DNA-binding NarL/FixJ family response regulator
MKPIKVAIIEDKADIREGLCALLNLGTETVCNLTFEMAEDALHEISSANTDVVLMDIELPGINGLEATRKLKLKMPNLQIIMLTVFTNPEKIFQALENGASGYLLKKASHDELIAAILDVYSGGSPMSSEIARKVVERFHKPRVENEVPTKLTEREIELLDALSRGYRYKEIADKLFISTNTVRSHIRNIYEKLQVQSKIEAINKFKQ